MMGKRSDFERKPRDFYPTPMEAVKPLLEHLPEDFLFAEPCAGNGVLIEHLETKGVCMWASDIEPQTKGIHKNDYSDVGFKELIESEYVITNPPWDRNILHPMISWFLSNYPSILFDPSPHYIPTKEQLELDCCFQVVCILPLCSPIKNSVVYFSVK